MVILPLHKKPTRRNFPYVTAALILVNVLVFFVLQAGDGEAEWAAAEHYHASGLSEQEWQWFDEFVSPRDRRAWEHKQEADELAALDVAPEYLARVRALRVEAHPEFLDAVRSGAFAGSGDMTQQEWRDARREYERLRAESFTDRYLLRYYDPDAPGLLASMFMHGGLGHLLGNMVFLALLGLVVEGATRRGVFLGAYLATGLAAAGASLAVHWGAPTGMVGASGAVAGLMGLYTVLYGWRRVRFFYWALVYFDYARWPAIVLLPPWLAWEVALFLLADGAPVAYEAHIGGAIAGALLALGIRRTGLQNDAFIEEGLQREDDREQLQQARAALAALKPEQAKRLVRPLVDRHPDDPDVLGSWYAACKLRPGDEELHQAAHQVLVLDGEMPGVRRLVAETLRDYMRQPRRSALRPALVVELAQRLAHWEEEQLASQLLNAVLRMRRPPAGTAQACRALARRLAVQGQQEAAERYRRHAERLVKPPEAD